MLTDALPHHVMPAVVDDAHTSGAPANPADEDHPDDPSTATARECLSPLYGCASRARIQDHLVSLWRRRTDGDAPSEEVLWLTPSATAPYEISKYKGFHRAFVDDRARNPTWRDGAKKYALVYDLRAVPLPTDMTAFLVRAAEFIAMKHACEDAYIQNLHCSVVLLADDRAERFMRLAFRALGPLPTRPIIALPPSVLDDGAAGELVACLRACERDPRRLVEP